jgi:hypothetical protein
MPRRPRGPPCRCSCRCTPAPGTGRTTGASACSSPGSWGCARARPGSPPGVSRNRSGTCLPPCRVMRLGGSYKLRAPRRGTRSRTRRHLCRGAALVQQAHEADKRALGSKPPACSLCAVFAPHKGAAGPARGHSHPGAGRCRAAPAARAEAAEQEFKRLRAPGWARYSYRRRTSLNWGGRTRRWSRRRLEAPPVEASPRARRTTRAAWSKASFERFSPAPS